MTYSYIFSNFNLGDICDYFGVKIALYFAWLGHYTTALFIPTIVGIIFWVITTDIIFSKLISFSKNVLEMIQK